MKTATKAPSKAATDAADAVSDERMDMRLVTTARELEDVVARAENLRPILGWLEKIRDAASRLNVSPHDDHGREIQNELDIIATLLAERIETHFRDRAEELADARIEAKLGWVKSCERRDRIKAAKQA